MAEPTTKEPTKTEPPVQDQRPGPDFFDTPDSTPLDVSRQPEPAAPPADDVDTLTLRKVGADLVAEEKDDEGDQGQPQPQDQQQAQPKTDAQPGNEVVGERFMAMGAQRSVINVWRQYDRDTTIFTPALQTIRRWSRERKWNDEAKDYDEKVAKGAVEHLAQNAAIEVADRARLFQMIAREGAEATLLALQRLRKQLDDTTGLFIPPAGIKALADLAVAASRQAELLEGRPTDRDADATKSEWEATRNEIMDQLEQHLREGWPPPGATIQ